MKLSDAILLSTTLFKQGYGSGIGEDGSRCALIGAGFVNGVKSEMVGDSADFWPWLRQKRVSCPVSSCNHTRVMWVAIAHLNDTHHWTRERIAAWVATIEPAEPNPAEETVMEGTGPVTVSQEKQNAETKGAF
jgi:hypothetical protein